MSTTREVLPIQWVESNIPGEASADLGDVELLINPNFYDGANRPPTRWSISVRSKATTGALVNARASLSCRDRDEALRFAQTLVDIVRGAA